MRSLGAAAQLRLFHLDEVADPGFVFERDILAKMRERSDGNFFSNLAIHEDTTFQYG